VSSKIIEQHIPCPNCPSSDAYCLYDDGHGYCYSCLTYTRGDQVVDEREYTYEFYGRRGITAECFRHYGCQTKVNREGKPISVGYRYPNGSVKIRDLEEKKFHWFGTPEPGLYGTDIHASGSNKYCVVTEGEEDAHSLWQVLKIPACSVQSSATAKRDCVASFAWLSGFDRVYLCFDNDGPGREALASVARLFDYNKVYVVRLSRKDANEHLQHGEVNELVNVWTNAKRYTPDNIISTFTEFEDALSKDTAKGIPYPWPTLSEMTGGIRQYETVLVTAPEGVGKTEWMKAVEYHLLKETDDNVGAIYIEEPKEWHLRSLVGIEQGKPVHLPDQAIPVPEQVDTLRKLLKRDERLFLYSHFGSVDPDTLLDTIRFLVSACLCRYILLDHITMAVTGLAGEDERRALDYLMSRLEMMVKELGFALIIVSHVNDFGQTRGSRAPGKLADIRIDLSRDVLSADPIIQSTITQTISKPCRFTGRSGFAGSITFNSNTRKFTEVANDNAEWKGTACA
jgi:twinkle protein